LAYKNNNKKARVVLLDIETSPLTAYTWKAFDDNALKILEFSKIMSVSWKELHSDEVLCKALPDYRGYKDGTLNDERLVKEIWKVLDDADVVIAHHGDRFDLPKLNARFVYYGLTAPSTYKSIDTKKVASRYFKFDSNSLNNLGAYLNLGAKVENGGFSLWDKCIQGDKDAWERMKNYNTQDVLLLEKVYLTLRPFMENHPNLGLLSGSEANDSCPTCQSTDVIKRGFSVTRTGRKQRYQCQECGSWSSGKFEKSNLKSLLVGDDD
jgi:DNA polymerase elongation subunit (family B)